jgi:rsbT co-antagonist protein RsbR
VAKENTLEKTLIWFKDTLDAMVQGTELPELKLDPKEKKLVKLKEEIDEHIEGTAEFLQSAHEGSLDLALGLAECFETLKRAKAGDLEAEISASTLDSSNEVVAQLGHTFNETIADLREMIQQQEITIQELATPVLEIWDDVLAVPLVGTLDSQRSQEVMEKLLSSIVTYKVRFVIVDLTGVQVVDTRTADHLIKIAQAAGLLGTRCIVTGINPAVAQSIVELGIDLSDVITRRNLKEGLRVVLDGQQDDPDVA